MMCPAQPARALLVVLALLFAGACAEGHLQPLAFREWSAGVSAEDPKNAAVVVLAEKERYFVVQRPNAPAFTEIQRYRVVKVLSEEGFEAASAHVWVPAKGRLLDLRARTITPTGEAVAVDVKSVLADSFAVAGEEGGTRSFQFPRVEVGSILEQTSVVRREGAWWSFSGSPVGKYPVKVYDLEIVLDRFATPDLFLDNAKVPLSYSKDADGTQHIGLQLTNIASSSEEPFRPHNSELHPRWTYRTIEWRYPRYVQPGVSSWPRAVYAPFHKLIVEKKNLDGLPALGGAARCAGERGCLIAAALAQVRDDVVFTGFENELDVRPVEQMVTTRTANNIEKAVYLWALLKGAGVDARIAVTARRGTARIHETFPSSSSFNHALVLAPGGVWLDPSCEHCAAGELPDWSRGARALPLSVRDGQYGNELSSEGFVDVTGAVAAKGTRIRRYDLKLAENGDVDVTVEEEASGSDATDIHVDTRAWTKKDAEAASLRIAKHRSQSGRSLEAEPWRCDRGRGVCRWRHVFRLPAFATLEAETGSLVLPLEVMNVQREQWFAKSQRKLPIVIQEHQAVTEVLRLVPPPGFHVDTAGLPVGAGRAEGYAASVGVTREQDTVVITRTDDLEAGRHPPGHWQALHKASHIFRSARTFAVRAVPTPPAAAPGP